MPATLSRSTTSFASQAHRASVTFLFLHNVRTPRSTAACSIWSLKHNHATPRAPLSEQELPKSTKVSIHTSLTKCEKRMTSTSRIHFSAPNPYWILLVNNFDLKQLQIFSDWIQSEEFVKVLTDYGTSEEWGWKQDEPVYDQNVSLRFQMDDHTLFSATNLCGHVYFERRGEAPSSLIDLDTEMGWLGIPEITTQYIPRTTAPVANRQSMTIELANRIKSIFEVVENTIVEMPTFFIYGDELKRGEAPRSFYSMDWCWSQEFYECVEVMNGVREIHENRAKQHREILRDARRHLLRSPRDEGR